MGLLRFFFFNDMRTNLLVYFTVTTIVLYLGPEWFMPSLRDQRIQNSPFVHTPNGDLIGTTLTSRNGRAILAFRSIPYAVPPINDLRYSKPKPIPSWKGVLEATKRSPPCIQPSRYPFLPTIGQEDCLYLNVYVPEIENEVNDLPVMVWFHGGGFTSGQASMYGPEHLLDKDVILVTVNYRLGPLGFFTLGNEEVPGNQGMWDQYEGLRWVQNNIKSFGGNPSRVTIFGESAGGWSVTNHLASRKSKGLYQAAIIQSGPIELPGFSMIEVHQNFATKLGCDGTKDVVQCLRSKSAKEIVTNYNLFDQCNVLASGMVPLVSPKIWYVVDDHKYLKDPFFDDHPKNIISEEKFTSVPTMIGVNKNEGLLFSSIFHSKEDNFKYYQENWEVCFANYFLRKYFIENLDEDTRDKVKKIKEFYFGDKPMDMNVFENITNLFSDPGFLYGTDLLVRQLSQKSNVFYYYYDHLGVVSLADIISSTFLETVWAMFQKIFRISDSQSLTKGLGVAHGDELSFLFELNILGFVIPNTLPERDLKMIDFMVELWTNFAINHNPHESWPVSKDNSYVILDDSKIKFEKDPSREERIEFWKQMNQQK